MQRAAAAAQAQARSWVFTINNPSSTDLPQAPAWVEKAKFCVWQLELSGTGTRHLQGYINLKQPARLAALKKLDPTAHWEVRRGTHKEAYDYSTKEDTRIEGPFEYGEAPEQGKRNDLGAVKRAIDEGYSDKEIADDFFSIWVRHQKAFALYRAISTPPRNFKTNVTVIYGPTGVGKTHDINEQFPDAYWLTRTGNGTVYFDGYSDQKAVVIDEFYGWFPYDLLLRLLDKYPMQVSIRGSAANFVAEHVILSSNAHPTEWYKFATYRTKGYPALYRRLDLIIERRTRTERAIDKAPGHELVYPHVQKFEDDAWSPPLPSAPPSPEQPDSPYPLEFDRPSFLPINNAQFSP